ncbi:MAG TPA: hypothetical protein VMH04_17310 [Candidatus Solibacter sp.]|nr:hypothetical protein [Candidatus Solibacter sp.]
MRPASLPASVVFFVAVLLLGTGAIAQTSDKVSERVQVSGGYSYLGYSVYQLYSGPWKNFAFNGWQASGAFTLAPHFAAEADFSGNYGSNGAGSNHNSLTYMGGPRLSGDLHRLTLYGHALFGALHFNGSYDPVATSFAAALGGGADFWITRHLGAQAVQIDDIINHNSSALGTDQGGPGPRNHLRISTGITLRF